MVLRYRLKHNYRALLVRSHFLKATSPAVLSLRWNFTIECISNSKIMLWYKLACFTLTLEVVNPVMICAIRKENAINPRIFDGRTMAVIIVSRISAISAHIVSSIILYTSRTVVYHCSEKDSAFSVGEEARTLTENAVYSKLACKKHLWG